MAILTKTFHRESERVQHEHNLLKEELHTLDVALDHLTANFDDPVNLIAAKEIQMFTEQLADELPPHFQREEQSILATVSEVSQELNFFAHEMQHQHEVLREQLSKFCATIDEMSHAEDLAKSVERVRSEGKAFTQELKNHIALEEQELAGFL